ncbi:hypothetical protein ACGFYY_35465 [Streptomyces sp. NPDC048331]|uniref:hypothetical protein n=1 Tax=Streptomyces sp. NPDC048331 TaxID=3365534 RepID=UPI003716DD50
MDRRPVRTARVGRRSPLAGLTPVAPGGVPAEVARMARVGRAAVVNWHSRHHDFPRPTQWPGTDVHPRFDRRAVVAWLLAHDKIEVPTGPTISTRVPAGTGGYHAPFPSR